MQKKSLTTVFAKIATHLRLNFQDMFRSFNDHHQLKAELIEVTLMLNKDKIIDTDVKLTIESNRIANGNNTVYDIDVLVRKRELN